MHPNPPEGAGPIKALAYMGPIPMGFFRPRRDGLRSPFFAPAIAAKKFAARHRLKKRRRFPDIQNPLAVESGY